VQEMKVIRATLPGRLTCLKSLNNDTISCLFDSVEGASLLPMISFFFLLLCFVVCCHAEVSLFGDVAGM